MMSLKTKLIRAFVNLKWLAKTFWFELKNWGPPYIDEHYPTEKAYGAVRHFFELIERENSESRDQKKTR